MLTALTYAALALSAIALLIAFSARSKAAGLAQSVDDARVDARRHAQSAAEESAQEVAKLRQLLALLRSGAELSEEMILEGRTWRDVSPAEGLSMLQAGGLHVLDVRTPQETAVGILPGAQLIPVDQLEARIGELPRDGKKMLVYCAGGGRSAAACEFLSKEGLSGLHNLEGGISSWSGPVERAKGPARS
jgi:rhodanese-related sulfurtransferase